MRALGCGCGLCPTCCCMGLLAHASHTHQQWRQARYPQDTAGVQPLLLLLRADTQQAGKAKPLKAPKKGPKEVRLLGVTQHMCSCACVTAATAHHHVLHPDRPVCLSGSACGVPLCSTTRTTWRSLPRRRR
jgi:hypothetical protein